MIHDSGNKSGDPARKIVLEEMTDPVELAKMQSLQAQYERNCRWFQAHALEIGSEHQGRCVCVSGEELFVADSPKEAIALAAAAHPAEEGRFIKYVPKEKLRRIYAYQR